jgi:DNA repair photolyase
MAVPLRRTAPPTCFSGQASGAVEGREYCTGVTCRQAAIWKQMVRPFLVPTAAEFRNPVAIVTKNRLVARDADLLGELAGHAAAAVFLSITTLDGGLARVLEPRAPQPAARLAALAELRRAGVPAGVLVAPVIPGINDHEIPSVLAAAAQAGASYAGYIVLRLPHGVADLFGAWLERHFPDRKEKVLGRIRDLRGGGLNDPRFGHRMRGEGVLAEQIKALFAVARRRAGITARGPELSAAAFRRPGGTQRLLFE